ncbi:DUF6166 domain-containing protein [Sulfurimonas sp.]
MSVIGERMSVDLKNKYFVGTRGFYGSNSVKYQNQEIEVPSHEYDFSEVKNSFDWGNTDQGATLLASAILKKLSSPTVARVYANKFTQSVISNLQDDTWELEAIEVAKWINANTDYKIEIIEIDEDAEARKREEEAKEKRRIAREKEFQAEIQRKLQERNKKEESKKAEVKKQASPASHNIVDKICKELNLSIKGLAKVLNMPNQTISDWRLENEMPKMALKAIEFYRNAYETKQELENIQKTTNKKVNDADKYKNETAKYKAEITKLKAQADKNRLELDKYKSELSAQKREINKYKKFLDAIDIPALYKKFNSL